MIKRNTIGRPYDLRAAGSIQVNIEDHDGYIAFGRNEYLFTTKWQPLGTEARVYNDPAGISGVAVLRESNGWTTLTHEQLLGLNYTSRTREVSPGQLVIYLSETGYFLVIKFTSNDLRSRDDQTVNLSYYILKPSGQPVLPFEVRVGQDGSEYLWSGDQAFLVDDEGSFLTDDVGRLLVVESSPDMVGESALAGSQGVYASAGYGSGQYGVVTTEQIAAERPEDAGAFDLYRSAQTDLSQAVQDAIEALDKATAVPLSDTGYGGLGHNNPPPDVLLDDSIKREVIEALQRINREASRGPDALDAAISTIRKTASQMLEWAAPEIKAGAATGVREGTKLLVLSPIVAAVGMAGAFLLRVLDIAQGLWAQIL